MAEALDRMLAGRTGSEMAPKLQQLCSKEQSKTSLLTHLNLLPPVVLPFYSQLAICTFYLPASHSELRSTGMAS